MREKYTLFGGSRGEEGALGMHGLPDSKESTGEWGFQWTRGTDFSKCLGYTLQRRQQTLVSQTQGESLVLVQWDPARFDL